MRLGKALKITLIAVPLIVVALVVAAIVILMNTDFNRYKPLIAAETKKATGRDLVIAGDLKLDISLTPAVYVAGVTLSNANWGSRREMVKVERFEAQISLIPVLFGVIDVKRVVLIGADILLEVDRQGRANFAFAPPATKSAGKPAATAPAEKKDMAIPIVREVVIENSRLAYKDAGSGASYDVGIDRLTVSGDGPDAPIALLYEGSYNKAGIELTAALGSPNDLMAGKPLPVDLDLRAGGANVTVKGRIGEPMAARGLDLAISVSGKQLGDLSALAGAAVPALGAYSLSTRVTGDPAAAVNLAGLKGALAGNDVAGDVTINLAGKRPFIDAKLSSNKIDLTALAGPAGGEAPAGKAQPAAQSDRVFPDDPLPLDGLQAVDAKLKLDAKTIVAAGARLQNASVGLSLKGGNLNVEPLKAEIADGTIDGAMNLDGRAKDAKLALKATLLKVDLDKLLTELELTEDVEGRANIDLDARGTGGSVRAIMASLDGRAGVLMGKGRMKDSFMQSMLGGSGQLLNQVLDKGQKGYTVVECAVADFEIRKGIASAKALYMDLESRGIIGEGTVNLGAESLDLTIDPRKKRSMDKAVLPVRITGTFLAPKYRVDKAVATQKLTKALGIELPPGLAGGQQQAKAPLIEGPCAPPAPAAAAQQPAQQQPAPSVPAQPQDVMKDAEQELKKGLKGLFGQ
ncbi:MAG: AsmA family protein [Alphaproteobacteria bacterium]|nr:AsmA family protein [Alphaproteobacteria bacterium]